MMIGNGGAERWRTLGDGHAQVTIDICDLDFHYTGAGTLAQFPLGLAVDFGAHVLRRDGGVPDKGRRVAGREVSQLHVVIAALGFQHKGGLAVHFGRDRLHLLVRKMVRIQHHDGRIAAETLARERIDVKQPATAIRHIEPETPRELRKIPDVLMAEVGQKVNWRPTG